MPRFYFHTVHDSKRVADDEGGVFNNLEDATQEALLSLREILADDLKRGRAVRQTSIEIAGEDGHLLAQIPYTVALGT